MQDRFGAEQDAGRHQTHHQRQPQRLTHDRANLAVRAGAEALGDFRRGGQQCAGHQQKHRHPDRVAQRHGSQVARANTASHDRIDEAHGGGCQLRDDDGRGQGEQATQFCMDAGRASQGGFGSIGGNGIHRRGIHKTGAENRGVYALTRESGNSADSGTGQNVSRGWDKLARNAYTAGLQRSPPC
ncbi:hypothetical protein D3C85_955390 [compost metagenome]